MHLALLQLHISLLQRPPVCARGLSIDTGAVLRGNRHEQTIGDGSYNVVAMESQRLV